MTDGGDRGASLRSGVLVLTLIGAVVAILGWQVVASQSTNDLGGPSTTASVVANERPTATPWPFQMSVDAEESPQAEPVPAPQDATNTGRRRGGWWLFYGGADPLQRINLDTGGVTAFGIRAEPVLATRDELVVAEPATGSIGWLSLDDPGEMAEGWLRAWVVLGSGRNELWIREEGDDHQDLVSLESGRRRDRRSVPLAADPHRQPTAPNGVVANGIDIVNVNGVIYERRGDSFERAIDGRLMAFDSNAVLVERCEDGIEECSLHWYARYDWSEIDLAVPRSEGLAEVYLMGGGRWLVSRHFGDTSSTLIDLLGRVPAQTIPIPPSDLAINEDGTLLAYSTGADVAVVAADSRLPIAFVTELDQELGGALLFVSQG